MEECTIIPEVSGYVWKKTLLFQRLVDMYGRIV